MNKVFVCNLYYSWSNIHCIFACCEIAEKEESFKGADIFIVIVIFWIRYQNWHWQHQQKTTTVWQQKDRFQTIGIDEHLSVNTAEHH